MNLTPLLFWYIALAISFGVIALVLLLPLGDAMTLEIIGGSSGSGLHTLSFWGEQINATILQGNNSTWTVIARGGA